MITKTDIFVAGGGIAGLAAAIAMGDAGFRVICVDPVAPITNADAPGVDLRTTAYLQPAQAFLARIGVWGLIGDHTAALQTMRIADASGDQIISKDFDASDISDHPFGWNVGNWTMRGALLQRMAQLPNISFQPGVGVQGVVTRTDHAVLHLTDGTQIRARLLIAADGRDSLIRTRLGIATKRQDFGQDALTFAVTHPTPHNNISTEVHKTGGPFTLIPLPDHGGQPCSAVVWMDNTAHTAARLAMPPDEFNTMITDRSAGVLGPLRLASHRSAWPIITQLAQQFYGERTAIVAEAAHVAPPIGAQGLNMSLADIETITTLATTHRNDPGALPLLQQYHDIRRPDVALRMRGIWALNHISKSSNPLTNRLRATGVDAIHSITPLRQHMMRMGLFAQKPDHTRPIE